MEAAITNRALFTWRERPFQCTSSMLSGSRSAGGCTQGVCGGVYRVYTVLFPAFTALNGQIRPFTLLLHSFCTVSTPFCTVSAPLLHRFLIFPSFIIYFLFYIFSATGAVCFIISGDRCGMSLRSSHAVTSLRRSHAVTSLRRSLSAVTSLRRSRAVNIFKAKPCGNIFKGVAMRLHL